MIGFKTLRQLREWAEVDPRLREMVEEAYDSAWPPNVHFIVTDIYRTLTENAEAGAETTIHVTPPGTPHRAADARAWHAPETAVRQTVEFVRARWEYDPARPSKPPAYPHNAGSGLHIHFQVHPNTRRRA